MGDCCPFGNTIYGLSPNQVCCTSNQTYVNGACVNNCSPSNPAGLCPTGQSCDNGSCVTKFTLSYSAGANGTISGTSSQTVNQGSSGSPVYAASNTGYHFMNWTDSPATTPQRTDNPRTDVNVQTNISATANFSPNTFNVSYLAGPGGKIIGDLSQTVNQGSSGTPVTAVPNDGYQFVNWTDYPSVYPQRTDNPRTDTNVQTSISATANFSSISVYFVIDGTDTKTYGGLSYRNYTIQNRMFDPGNDDVAGNNLEEIDPFSDIDCVFKEQSGTGLIPSSASLLSNGKEVNSGGSTKFLKTEGGYDYYVLPILGYAGGAMPSIAPNDLKKDGSYNGGTSLIVKNQHIKCLVKFDSIPSVSSADAKVNLCSHYWGDIDNRPANTKGFKIAVVPESNVFDGSIDKVKSIKSGNDRYNPFKTYNKNFAYYLDVAPKQIDQLMFARYRYIAPAYLSSNCGSDIYSHTINNPYTSVISEAGLYIPGIPAIFEFSSGQTNPEYVFVHEEGHLIGKLDDEYVYKKDTPLVSQNNCTYTPISATNNSFCSALISKYPASEADSSPGFYSNSGCYQGCTNSRYFRTTPNSIMRYNDSGFNAVSCAAIMKKIKPGNTDSQDFGECSAMDTIEKDPSTNLIFTNPLSTSTWQAGTTQTISWTVHSNGPDTSMTVFLVNQNNNMMTNLGSAIPIAPGSFTAQIPADITPGTYYIEATTNGTENYLTSTTFNIVK